MGFYFGCYTNLSNILAEFHWINVVSFQIFGLFPYDKMINLFDKIYGYLFKMTEFPFSGKLILSGQFDLLF